MIPGWLWVVLSCLCLGVVITVAAIMLVTNRLPWKRGDR
jgi:hypothetical protein